MFRLVFSEYAFLLTLSHCNPRKYLRPFREITKIIEFLCLCSVLW